MFKFTIRDVLWLTLVVGLAIGWWLNRLQLRQELAGITKRAEAFELLLRWEGWVWKKNETPLVLERQLGHMHQSVSIFPDGSTQGTEDDMAVKIFPRPTVTLGP